jgi:dUTP pyrophosphatase
VNPPSDQEAREQAYYKALHALSDRKGPTLKYFLSDRALELNLEHPKAAYNGDAGLDLRLCSEEPLTIQVGERAMVYSGVGFEIPDGWWGNILPRTSTGQRGLIPVAKVVDSNFTGILTLCLANIGTGPLTIEPRERIAQIVFTQHLILDSLECIPQATVKKTERGPAGFGTSGRF